MQRRDMAFKLSRWMCLESWWKKRVDCCVVFGLDWCASIDTPDIRQRRLVFVEQALQFSWKLLGIASRAVKW